MGLSLNKAIIIGNLGGDPEIFEGRSGSRVVSFNVATSYRKGGRGGEEKTEWHRVKCLNEQLADIAEKWLYKGAKVYVEGYMEHWQNDAGKSGVDILARELILLSPLPEGERERTPEPPQQYRRGKQRSSSYQRRGAPRPPAQYQDQDEEQAPRGRRSYPGAAQNQRGRGQRTVGRPNTEPPEQDERWRWPDED